MLQIEPSLLFKLAQTHYFETGNYTTFLTQNGWKNTDAHCENSFSGNYATTAIELCKSIIKKPKYYNKLLIGCDGSDGVPGQCDNINEMSVGVPLDSSGSNTFCIGSSGGGQYTAGGPHYGLGCYYNP